MDPKTAELRLFLCDNLQAATNEWGRKKAIKKRGSILRKEALARFEQAQRMLDELDRLIAHATADDDFCDECGLNPTTHVGNFGRLCTRCYTEIYEPGEGNALLCQICGTRPMLTGNMAPDACDECATAGAKAAFAAAIANGVSPEDAAEGLWREEELLAGVG